MNNFNQFYDSTDTEFYPTPDSVIYKMIDGIKWDEIETILEPSAGKGNIVDIVNQKMKSARDCSYNRSEYESDIDCIEINPQLQNVLRSKNYRVVADDFLSYNTYKKYNLIIMNPPFSNGEQHLMKAIEMQEDGGYIVCILNAETIKNPYSNSRKALVQKLSEYNAEITYMSDAFISAEHKTNVEIAIIKIKIKPTEHKSYFYEKLRNDHQYDDTKHSDKEQYGTLVKNDFIDSIVDQYNLEVRSGIELIKEYWAMQPHILNSFDKDDNYKKPIIKMCFNDDSRYDSTLSINKYVQAVRRKYWTALFNNKEFTRLLTSNLRDNYYNRINELVNFDFSFYNIYTIKQEMAKNMVTGVEDEIVRLFDELSQKYSWSKEFGNNIHYYNGWSHNKAWYINSKIIIPMNIYDGIFEDFRYDHGEDKFHDIEKSLNYLDTNGNQYNPNDLHMILEIAKKNKQTRNIQTDYLTIDFYKKGTVHITFNNLELLKKLNLYGSKRKGWLPPSYGKKHYKDMSKEEQDVIDDFQGENDYEEVLNHRAYYLDNQINNIKMLGA